MTCKPKPSQNKFIDKIKALVYIAQIYPSIVIAISVPDAWIKERIIALCILQQYYKGKKLCSNRYHWHFQDILHLTGVLKQQPNNMIADVSYRFGAMSSLALIGLYQRMSITNI